MSPVARIERIRYIAAYESGKEVVDLLPETEISDLGLDSLEFLEFLAVIRKEIGPISDEAAVKANTLLELAQAIGS